MAPISCSSSQLEIFFCLGTSRTLSLSAAHVEDDFELVSVGAGIVLRQLLQSIVRDEIWLFGATESSPVLQSIQEKC